MIYQDERKEIEAFEAFYFHLIMYGMVMGALYLIDPVDRGNGFYFATAFGWGILVLLHGLTILFSTDFVITRWNKEKIRTLLSKPTKHYAHFRL